MKLWNHLRNLKGITIRFQPLFNARCFSDASLPHLQQPSPPSSSLNRNELAKFAAIAETWWDSDGPFKPLHLMNPTRLAFIRSALCRHFRKDPYSAKPLEGLKIVDVGCGGGILSEPLARMGATVTGIDAVEKNIKIARLHADLDPTTSSIEFSCTTAEKLVEEGRKFDAVMALEVIEHVADPAEFCKSLSALTIPDGATVISTINHSMRAYATAIVAAEYILRWVLFLSFIFYIPYVVLRNLLPFIIPYHLSWHARYIKKHCGCNQHNHSVRHQQKEYYNCCYDANLQLTYCIHSAFETWQLPIGTHEWSTFLTPEELVLILQRAGINVEEMAGFVYNPVTGRWLLSDDISVNFIALGAKTKNTE